MAAVLWSAARASQATRQCSTSQYFHNEKAKRKCEHLYLAKQYLLLLMSGDNKRCPGKVINPASSSLKKRQMEVKALRNNGTEVNNHRQSHHPGSLEPELMICLCSRALVRHLAALFGSNIRDRKMPRHPNQEQCLIFTARCRGPDHSLHLQARRRSAAGGASVHQSAVGCYGS